MKYALLFLVFFSTACGKITVTKGSSGVGTLRELQTSDVSTGDAVIYDGICQALTKKSQKLAAALPNALQFEVVERDCAGNTVTFGTQQVRVEKATSGEYQFRRQDTNGLFVFPQAETQNFGFMKELCAGASKMPVVSNESATWISTSGFTGTDCPANGNDVCLVVERGLKETGTQSSYRIYSREFVRFNVTTTSGKYGYFTHRKAYASNNCDDGKLTESSVSLR